MRALRILAVLAIVAAVAGAAEPAESSSTIVRAFYRHHFAHDMRFSEASLKEKAAWLAPDLHEKLLAELRRPHPTDEVPTIDGDPFADSQEYPTSFTVGRERGAGKERRVPVRFSWPQETRALEVVLRRAEGGWRIDDLRYSDGGTLRGLLGPPHRD